MMYRVCQKISDNEMVFFYLKMWPRGLLVICSLSKRPIKIKILLKVRTSLKIQNNHEIVNLSTYWGSKWWQLFFFNWHQSLWSGFQSKMSLKSVTDAFFGTICIAVSPKSGIFKFHCQWILATMTFDILKIYFNMLADTIPWNQGMVLVK